MKKCLLIIIDALNARLMRPAMAAGRMPNMQRLIDAGQVRWNSVSIFPSITPAATSSICTGKYPAEHRVLGAHYYDRVADEVHYFGSDLSVVMKLGFRAFFDDFLLALNHRCLDADTLFEKLELAGHRCASINYLVFRGRCEHSAQTPWLLWLLPTIPAETVLRGPEILCVGDFVAEEHRHEEEQLKGNSGLIHRFGFNDKSTGKYMLQLVDRGLPPFTIAYFPDNDFHSHERDPYTALDTVEEVDTWLGEMAERFGGFEGLLAEMSIVISGDHAQSDIVPDAEQAGIKLEEVLEHFKLVYPGDQWDREDQLMVCVNLRATQIYIPHPLVPRSAELVNALLKEPRVDQVIWSEALEDQQPTRFVVATADRGKLSFQLAAQGQPAHTDTFGGRWLVEGDWRALDAKPNADGTITFGAYPNAFERIAMSFDPRFAGDLWVTARVGHEFSLPRTSVHTGGGSHGSLHAYDSLSPLILAGNEQEITLPEQTRTVDIAPLCLKLLNEPSDREVGESAMRHSPNEPSHP